MSLLRRPPAAAQAQAGLGLGGSIQIHPASLTVGAGACATLAVTGYPAEVTLGWLEPLLTYPGRLDVCLHIEPVPPQIAADRLRRQRAKLHAARWHNHDTGRLVDYTAEAAAHDADQMAADLARGHEKLFRAGLYLTVHAADPDSLDEQIAQLRALAASLLLATRPTTFRALQGFVSTLPFGLDALKIRRTMDTTALATSFPFTSPDLAAPPGPTAVLYGVNAASSSLVMWDRWACDNYNAVIIGSSGGGKSYLGKLAALRSLYAGVQVAVIDPEDEYTRLGHAVGAAHIALGPPGVRLNPFDLPAGREADALTRRTLFGHTLISVLVGEPLSPAARAALDRALLAAYESAGISHDPRSWNRPAPLLADLAQALVRDGDPAAAELAARLAPYVTGSWRGLFDGPTTTRPDGHLVIFTLKHLPDELKAVGVLLTLDAIWRRVTDPADARPREVIVDEGWLLMQQPEGAKFLYRMAKAARKHWAALTVITQDAADMLATQLGQAVVHNAATQLLLRQSHQAIDQISHSFGLSDGERSFLLTAQRGEALLVSGSRRCAFAALASPQEHFLITTDPEFLATLEADDADQVGDAP